MIDYESTFSSALEYGAFLEKYGTPDHQSRWSEAYDHVQLTDSQRSLLGSFVRNINVLCLAGAWCGDCVGQCPIFRRFAEATSKIHLRFIDRDDHPKTAAELTVCGGGRVPVVLFLSEDFHECARYGDRTLSRYRSMAAELGGAACSTGLAGSDEAMAEVVADWLREFERVELMLRISPRLRKLHGD